MSILTLEASFNRLSTYNSPNSATLSNAHRSKKPIDSVLYEVTNATTNKVNQPYIKPTPSAFTKSLDQLCRFKSKSLSHSYLPAFVKVKGQGGYDSECLADLVLPA